jgi:hypothetical protein
MTERFGRNQEVSDKVWKLIRQPGHILGQQKHYPLPSYSCLGLIEQILDSFTIANLGYIV